MEERKTPQEPSSVYKSQKTISTHQADDWDTPHILSPPITIALTILAGGVGSLLIWSVVYELPITASACWLTWPRHSRIAYAY